MVFLSIIIPFKKSKRYLKDCLDSIREQNLSDYEIILIVNGSDEDISDLTSGFDNIIIKKYDEELGVGKARNIALDIAGGNYVYFIDSDDYIFEDGLQKLVIEARKTGADFINGQRIETYYIKSRFKEEFSVKHAKILKNNTSKDKFSMQLLVGDGKNLEVLSSLHALIKKDKIKEVFSESSKYYNDYEFVMGLLNNICSMAGVENAVYAKRISDDFINLPSLNQELKDKKLISDLYEFKKVISQIESLYLKNLMRKKIYDYYHDVFSHEYVREPNDEYLNAFIDVSDEFKTGFFNRKEINALKTNNKSELVKIMSLRVNFKRFFNLVMEPWRLYHILYYYIYNKRPIYKQRIVFESFSGNYYSDNPKYLYEYLYENYRDDFEFVWVLNNLNTEIPGNPIKVKRFSLKYHKLMATSKYWVINTRQAGRLIKRPDQVIISTWHGTPLKKLGFDMDNIYLNNPRTKERYIRDSSVWDYFISPNSFSTPILKRAFGYEGKMLETGYPRNDILYNADEDKIREIKDKLKLPENKKVILYAPTWRDDDAYDVGKVKFKLKLELDKIEELSDEYVILVRNHYLITDSDVSDFKEFAVDVSRYDDIAELYLISDILITDYSSVFFDYANLRRPMLFYMYDLEKYENTLRGFYIDIKKEVPGPILKTTEEVIDAVRNIDEISLKYSDKYDTFYENYCSIEDGNSAKRIVEKIWGKKKKEPLAEAPKKSLKNKLRNFKECAVNSMIYHTYYNEKIDEKLVYLESRDGLDFTGNIFRIVEELSTGRYGDLKIYVHAKPHVVDKIKAYQKNYNLKIDKIITKEATATRVLEKAKYIFTDSGIRPKYVKREGQIFVNTWHGTPLKVMGKDNVGEEHRVGQTQYTLLCSDYLLYPNDYMMNKMVNSYMIEKIFPGKILLEGYPRNSVFFDEKRKKDLKSILSVENIEIFAYMPTFRGIFMHRDDEAQKNDVDEYLSHLDKKLNDNQLLLVKLHVLNESQLDFGKFNHIKPFPKDYETYDILNIADVLITDYSSVFFDFANTGRKIILFNYDDEDYCSYRGFYFPLSKLPFPKVQNIDGLVKELNLPKNYDDSDFINKFCQYDRPDSVEFLCRHIFTSKCCNELSIKNNKENILIYTGSLLNNGITASVTNLLSRVDLNRYNFFISYRQWDENIIRNHEEIFKNLPEGVEFLPLRFDLAPTVIEKFKYNEFFLSNDEMKFPKVLNTLFERAFNMQYFPLNFKLIIDYDGYNKNESLIFSHNKFKNAAWVHNDMIQEIKTRNIQNRNVLKEVYSKSDNVCVVSKDLIVPTSEISGKSENIQVIHNINNYENIIKDSKKEIKFDKNTVYYSNSNIEDVLSKPGKKFITIGRFSPEKGHKRLINAFNQFCKDYPDSQLIIIGGHGVLYDDTVELIKKLEFGENITLIKGISNPMPILSKCDLFILPSYYEGWGIVIMEADTLGIPVIATDVVGTQWLWDYGGNLVESSEEGILMGMYDFMEGNIHTLNINYDEFNEEIISNFYNLID